MHATLPADLLPATGPCWAAPVAPAADAAMLQAWLVAAQQGDRQAYERVLRWSVARAEAVLPQDGRQDDRVADLLHRIHAVRHSYDRTACPLRWIDGLIRAVSAARPDRPWRRWLAGHR
ncbi:hypothetical protein [Paracraurococcus ruber]|uniref:Uncharacterized protein n=1 Tax=Paracraurococcus ruber TaxID=77675 RepID=A0ABS1CVP5_9PROT|nr:hypothetical protein [Paracraurococcus ruber]MBK1658589.1 hypothetical protein [Paracraurococcus ruber]TDG27431.1 hypothetical protein E2C05_22995 [Paracraurococcus ruber]